MKKYPIVCIVSNTHALLLYLLFSSEHEINNTFFFVENIHVNLNNSIRLTPPNRTRLEFALWMLRLRLLASTKYKFVMKAKVFCQDSLTITSPIINGLKYNLIEEGLSNYVYKKRRLRYNLIKRIMCGRLFTKEFFGHSDQAEKIYLTGMLPVPDALQDKVELINMQNLWENSSEDKKKFIMDVFGMDSSNSNFPETAELLITQPLSEDAVLTETEKIELYRSIVESNHLVIKPHPRERTNYRQVFPDVIVLNPRIPMELYNLVGLKVTDVYTVFSTAVLDFPYDVNIHFLGTAIHPKLKKHFGDIRYVNGKIEGTLYNK